VIAPVSNLKSSTPNKLAQGIYRRTRRVCLGDSNSDKLKWEYYGKFEPRFKPPRETLASGKILKFNSYLPLGGYDTEEDAKVVHQIAAFFYGKGQDQLDLGNGDHFSIDSVLNEQDRCLSGKEKAKWVSRRAREIFEVFKKEKAARGLLIETTGHSRVHSGEHVTNACDSSSKELGAFSSAGICKRVEGLASASEVSPFAESSQDGERRMLPHGPLHSSMVAAQVGVRGHALVQFAEPQHLKACVAPAVDQGHNLVAPQDTIAFLEQGNIGVDKDLSGQGGEVFRPVDPAPWRSSDVNQNLSRLVPAPTSADYCASIAGDPSVAYDLSFRVEEMETCMPPVPQDDADVPVFFVDDLYYIPGLPGMQLDGAVPMFDDLNPEPAWASAGIPNVVRESSAVAATLDKVNEGASHIYKACGSPIISPALTPHQGSDAVAEHLDMVAPSVTNFNPENSTADLLVILAKQIQERDRKIEEQGKLINLLRQELRERDRKIGKQKKKRMRLMQELHERDGR
jgi:hypothetical protein